LGLIISILNGGCVVKTRDIFLLIFVLIVGSSALASEAPRLVVVIVVDQMRADHLDRYSKQYTSGFKRLLSEGMFYSNAHLGYAVTATAPGHASLSTGVYPWKSGIVGNSFVDRTTNRKVYSVEDSTVLLVDGEGGRMSPRNLKVTALGDWLKAASPRSKVISISYKDRPAVLMGGRKPTYAFWYNRATGHMVTSSYYVDTLPTWAKEFNSGNWVEKNLSASWTKLKPDFIYEQYGPDDLEGETPWSGKTGFPHPFSPEKKAGEAFNSPFGNSMLLDFAREALRNENLGNREVTDLLCISLSSTDLLGSLFGPNSHEMIDNLLRLDIDLDLFLADLTLACGRNRLLVILTGDHGVMQLPEYLTSVEHRSARRIDNGKEIKQKLGQLDSLYRIRLSVVEPIVEDGFINFALVKKAGGNLHDLEKRIRQVLMGVDGVADVVFRTEILDSGTPDRPFLEAYRHSFFSSRSPDFYVRHSKYCLVTESKVGTSHGSPYEYDTHVPIIFWGPRFALRKVERPVHTVDLAPTLAKMLNLNIPNNLDGAVLKEVTQR
jgi:predicted AlkP superfamily pyrophosphatase or phosphodiesterase